MRTELEHGICLATHASAMGSDGFRDRTRLDHGLRVSDECDPTEALPDPSDLEVEYLIRVWAEVGMAILMRRRSKE